MNDDIIQGRELLYTDLAWMWHIFSKPADYREEAEFFLNKIIKHSENEVNTLLNLGTGGGNLDYILKNHLTITGVDISEDMLSEARKLNPKVRYIIGDMRDVRLDETFDAVLIHDSICYITTEDDLRKTFETAYHHLKSGGVILTFVEAYKNGFIQNKVRCKYRSTDDIQIISLQNDYDPNPNDDTYESHFIYIIRKDNGQKIYHDLHICGIFHLNQWRKLLKKVGFFIIEDKFTHSTFEKGESYPMFICKK